MSSLFDRIKDRKLFQWTLAYLVGCWVLLQVLGELADIVAWVDAIRPAALVAMLLGLPVVLVVAWFHGEQGRQRVTGKELLLAALGLGVVGGAIWAFGGSDGVPAGGVEERAGGSVNPDLADPAIAVLPGLAAGPSAEELAENIVMVLSTGLDAVDGWRAVSPRTVLARWNERIAEGEQPDEATALAIGRAAGGRYAVLPSASVLGSTARVRANVYDLREASPRPIAIDVEGSTDDLLPLADELALQVLRAVLVDEGAIPEIDLSRTTSESPEALRAFLRGEVAYRRFQLEEARDAFNLALEYDSTFARAHYRLMEVHNWGITWDTGEMSRHRQGAYEKIDRLTEREALVVRALMERDFGERIRQLRGVVARYPDDATAWNHLGERMIHNATALASRDEIREAFDRTLELDPDRAVFYGHPLMLAFGAADSAHAHDLVERFIEVASGVEGQPTGDLDPRGGRYAMELAFGTDENRAAAWRRFDLSDGGESVAAFGYLLGHPRYADEIISFVETLDADRSIPQTPGNSAEFIRVSRFRIHAYHRGRLDRALVVAPALADMPTGRRDLYWAAALGLPIPVETLDAAFAPARLSAASDHEHLYLAGLHAIDQGRRGDYELAVGMLRAAADTASADNPRPAGHLAALEAYATWRDGDPEAALEVLSDITSFGKPRTRVSLLHLGDLYLDLERWEDAERVFRTGAHDGIDTGMLIEMPLLRKRLALALDRQGRAEEAVSHYEYFLEHWYEPDPELLPLVEEARDAVARLTSGS